MKKLNLTNVEEIKQGAFKRPSNDRYLCKITKVEDFPDKEYLRLEYDIVVGEFKDYYTKLNKERQFSMPSMIRSYKESALGFFKGMITALEKTNPKFKWDWNEQSIVGKGLCLVLRDEEYVKNNGEVGTRTQVSEIHSKDYMNDKDFKNPETKKLSVDVPTKGLGGSFSVQSNLAPDPFGQLESEGVEKPVFMQEYVEVEVDEIDDVFGDDTSPFDD